MQASSGGYENLYREALRLLRERHGLVGQPYRTLQGQRVCEVAGLNADDHTVLLLAWGPEFAEQIEKTGEPADGPAECSDSNESEQEEELDQDWLSGFLVRWVLAEEFLGVAQQPGLPGEYALKVLIKRDIPALLRELARTRPDLQAIRGLRPN